MRTPASIAGHPIHPMLVSIPIGLWIFSLVCDLVVASGSTNEAWRVVALYTLIGGIAGALLAALPGLIDLVSLPEGPRKTALIHMGINLTVVALYAVNAWLRLQGGGGQTPLILSLAGVGLLAVSGWLGGKMVYVHGVAVSSNAEGVSPQSHAADRTVTPPQRGRRPA
jgi:uncharacterized membrane protein